MRSPFGGMGAVEGMTWTWPVPSRIRQPGAETARTAGALEASKIKTI